jgi:hypothetical protein
MTGICSAGGEEGATCQGDWAQALRPYTAAPAFCAGCAPGLVCWNGSCRRPCRPEDGGLDNCIPNEQTQLFNTVWTCSLLTGYITPSAVQSEVPLCTVCAPHRLPCQLPEGLALQTRTPGGVCCVEGDVCARTLDLTNGTPLNEPPTCCKPATHGLTDGGLCSDDDDCCAALIPGLGLVQRCCPPSGGLGCRVAGRCAGCGPGTGIPCCNTSEHGCPAEQTCVGSYDAATCIDCGHEFNPCCRRDGVAPFCSGDHVRCFSRPDEFTGARCEHCGAANEQCCPGDGCDSGNVCDNGVCQPCGGRDQPCCDGGQCGGERRQCQGGVCVQQCGMDGLQCCLPTDMRSGGPLRWFCLDRSNCNVTPTTWPMPPWTMCRACGANGQPVCDNSPGCDAGLARHPTTGLCVTCGGDGQPACSSGAPPCGAGLARNSRTGLCATCGQYTQPCCPDEPRCGGSEGEGYCDFNGFCQRPP